MFPLGSMRPRRYSAQIIAATNRDLGAEVAAGRFRADLYYRLAVVRLHIPPLAERRGDIAAIARRLAQDIAAELACAVPRLDAAAIAALEARDWPGNVRELRNALEHAMVVAEDAGVLRAGDFPAALPCVAPVASDVPDMAPGLSGDDVLAAIRACGGHKAQAARMLKVSRTTLYRHLQRLGPVPALA